MINFNRILSNLLMEAPLGSKRDRLIRAIKNRNPVSFYYNGKKGEVLPGRRIKAEIVALGVTKKGNVAVRGWVQPPSVSKKGFREHGWRLFIINNMSGIQVYEDETFETKRPWLNDSGDKSLTAVYATSDWGITSKPKQVEPQRPTTPTPTPQKPEIKQELPQPKQDDKPTQTPEPEINFAGQVYDELKSKIQDVGGQKQITPDEFSKSLDVLRKKKIQDWSNRQRELGANTNPGEGTRRRIEKDAEVELYDELKQNNVIVALSQLQESISRIRALMFF